MTRILHDLDTVAFEYRWRPHEHPEPGKRLSAAFPNTTSAQIEDALQRAARLYDAVNGNPFYGQPDMPTISDIVNYLRGAAPGLSDSAYFLGADRVCYLYVK